MLTVHSQKALHLRKTSSSSSVDHSGTIRSHYQTFLLFIYCIR